MSSRDKRSIFLKGVFEDRKCFEINNFFAGVDPDKPYKFQWLNFGLKFCTVCNVIAPRGSEESLQSFKTPAVNEVCSDDLTTLITAYKQASSKNLKTQILSIYAPRYSARFLKKIHEPFEKLSDRQIKKARAHAKNVGAGFNLNKMPHHRVRIDLVKLDHFLSFVDQPFFLSRCGLWNKDFKT